MKRHRNLFDREIQWVVALSLLFSGALWLVPVVGSFGFVAEILLLVAPGLLLSLAALIDLAWGNVGWRFLVPASLLWAFTAVQSIVEDLGTTFLQGATPAYREVYIWGIVLVTSACLLAFYAERHGKLWARRNLQPWNLGSGWLIKVAQGLLACILILTLYSLWNWARSSNPSVETWMAGAVPLAASLVIVTGGLSFHRTRKAGTILCIFWLLAAGTESLGRSAVGVSGLTTLPWDLGSFLFPAFSLAFIGCVLCSRSAGAQCD